MYKSSSSVMELLMAVLNTFADAVIACDREGEVVFLNQAARDLYGVPKSDPEMKKCAEKYGVFHPDGETLLNREELPLYRALHGESIKDLELVVRSTETPFARVLASANPIFEDSGALVGAMVVTRIQTLNDEVADEIDARDTLSEAESQALS